MRLDSNTSLDCEHEISPSDTHHRQAERDKIASALSGGNQSVALTRWRWCFTPLYAALFYLSRLLIGASVQVLSTALWIQTVALNKSQTLSFLAVPRLHLNNRWTVCHRHSIATKKKFTTSEKEMAKRSRHNEDPHSRSAQPCLNRCFAGWNTFRKLEMFFVKANDRASKLQQNNICSTLRKHITGYLC